MTAMTAMTCFKSSIWHRSKHSLKSDKANILNDSLGPKQLFEITHVFAVWHLGIEWHFSNLYIQGPNINK